MKSAVDNISEAFDKYLAFVVEGSHKAEPFTIEDLSNAIFKEKEAEKQQIMEAFEAGCRDDIDQTSLDYYKENYGNI